MKKIKLGISIKRFISIIGIGTLVANSITLYYIFISAFLNNSTILVNINAYNEGLLEFFLMPISLALGVYGLIYFFNDAEKDVVV